VFRKQQSMLSARQGQTWVSAALYTAVGIILVTIVLSVGAPFVDKIQDRNTILQTKNIMFEMDKIIREVELEGVGSRRPFVLDISEGNLFINDLTGVEKIEWIFTSNDQLGIESGENIGDKGPRIQEGNLNIQSTRVGQGYEINLWLDYDVNGIDIRSELDQINGNFELIIEHRQESGEDYVDIRSN
jgi:hypothetical protein